MSCQTSCKLCDRLVISNSVSFASGVLTINIPAGDYRDGCRYCLVIAQAIPSTATIGSSVVITIGSGTVDYPVTLRDCSPATVCNLRTRTKYPMRVATNATGGTFRILSKASCAPDNSLPSINGTAPTA